MITDIKIWLWCRYIEYTQISQKDRENIKSEILIFFIVQVIMIQYVIINRGIWEPNFFNVMFISLAILSTIKLVSYNFKSKKGMSYDNRR